MIKWGPTKLLIVSTLFIATLVIVWGQVFNIPSICLLINLLLNKLFFEGFVDFHISKILTSCLELETMCNVIIVNNYITNNEFFVLFCIA